MYNWREMTPEQRDYALRLRKVQRRPWHGPPHRRGETTLYHLTAANYEHRPVIGASVERMSEFERLLLEVISCKSEHVLAWCVLPNHYHLLVDSVNILGVISDIGRLHGRTSFGWNREEKCRGRKCWHRCVERAMKSGRHKWATLNYVLHNAVHHGYVGSWEDWPYSNVMDYLAAVGGKRAREYWEKYPVLDYGKGWDDPWL